LKNSIEYGSRCPYDVPRIDEIAVIDAAPYEERYLRAGQALGPRLRSAISKMVRRKDVTDELVQETFLRLLRAGKRSEPQAVHSMTGFVYSVARNVARDHLRRSKLDPVDCTAAPEIADPSQDPAEIVASAQELALLQASIDALPPRCRQIFTLRKVYGFSYKEIALQLNISPHTVEAQLTKALRRCAQALGR
jgi:RNA polymerase sigma-70 factor (ECF subfamily)